MHEFVEQLDTISPADEHKYLENFSILSARYSVTKASCLPLMACNEY